MATLYPIDDQTVTLGQKKGRMFVPAKTQPGQPLVSVRKGDVPKPLLYLGVQERVSCGEDRRFNRKPMPRRAAWGLEPDGAKPWLGKPREANFDLIVMDGEPLAINRWQVNADGSYTETSVPAYFTFFQWMGGPLPGTGAAWTSPQFELGLIQNANGLNIAVKLHTEVLPGVKEWVPWTTILAAPLHPIPRAQSLRIKAQFQDGFGGEGWAKVLVQDKLICNYVGRTGFKNHGNLFAGFQAYTSESPVETRLRFGEISEGPIGAVETTW